MDVAIEHGLRKVLLDAITPATAEMWGQIESAGTCNEEDEDLRKAIQAFSVVKINGSPTSFPSLFASFAAALLKRPEVANFWKEESDDIVPQAYALVARKEANGDINTLKNFFLGDGERWVNSTGERNAVSLTKKTYRRPTTGEIQAFVEALPARKLSSLLSALTW